MAKGGRGYLGTQVLKAELRATEVYPILKKNVFAVLQKKAYLPIFEIEFAKANHFFP